MAYRASFSSKSSRSSLINPYGIEMFFCVVTCIIFFIISYSENKAFSNIKYYTIAFSEPGLKIVSKPFDSLNIFFKTFGELKALRKDNIKLKLENENLKKNLNRGVAFEIENFRLKQLLKVDVEDYAKKITSRILIDPYKSNNSIFFIDVGKEDGLKINDVVFNEHGMIGRVDEVGKYSSKVLSIFSEDSVIPVISLQTKISFFVKGSSNTLSLRHIERPFDLNYSETVITTEAAGYFKEGIPVGKVVKTLNNVYVQPFAKISDSIYVNVLIFNFEKNIE